VTLREHTERPITVTQGTNRVVGTQTDAIVDGVRAALSLGPLTRQVPDGWDGRAAERIVEVLTTSAPPLNAQRPVPVQVRRRTPLAGSA
jgi:UDP-N-acetylglucosamine 2-epimerase